MCAPKPIQGCPIELVVGGLKKEEFNPAVVSS
jgi:hypothetical protein